MNPRALLKKTGFLLDMIPLNLLIKITNNKILLPFYHTVSNDKIQHIDNLYSIRDIDLFINDLDFFCKYYNPISIDELHQIILENKKISRPVFHLTFDDGLKEIYTIIAPILHKKGIPATFFVNTDFIDNEDLFYRFKISLIIQLLNEVSDNELISKVSAQLKISNSSRNEIIEKLELLTFADLELIDTIGIILKIDFKVFLSKNKPYLSSSEIIELKEKGFTFGSHSLNHPLFKDLSFNQQKTQILIQPRQCLKEWTNLSHQ